LIINIHAHLGHKNMYSGKYWEYMADLFSRVWGIPRETFDRTMLPKIQTFDAEIFVEQMDIAGIKKALVMCVDFGMSEVGEGKWTIEESNKWVAEQTQKYPDRLIPICAIDPRRGKKAVELLDKAVNKWEMRGLKFHPTAGYYPDDPNFFPLYKKCIELDVPLFSHTAATIGPPFMSKYADPIYLDTLAAKFLDLRIVLIHFGSLSYTYKCMEIMSCRYNLFAELSGYQFQARIMPERFLKILRTVFDSPPLLGSAIKERIMFGTDWPFLETVMDQKTWVKWLQSVPEKGQDFGLKFKNREIKKILYLNAEKFLKL